ncbi:MAG: alpha/beta fold hydrolase, partial [Pirellulaceae bacterium]
IDHLQLKKITLVAHDWGGAIGMGAVRMRADLFRRIVLLNTAAFPPPYFPLRIRACRMPLLGTAGVRGLNLFARAALTMATDRKGGLPAVEAAGLLAPYDSWKNRVAIDGFVRDIPTRPDQRTWQTLSKIENSLKELKIPKLLVWGMRDWCFRPECLDRFRAVWPEAKVVQFADAGHYVMLDKPNEVLAAIRDFVQTD